MVTVAVLIGTGVGVATRPDLAIRRASASELRAAQLAGAQQTAGETDATGETDASGDGAVSGVDADVDGGGRAVTATTLLPPTPLRSELPVGSRSTGGSERDLTTPAALSIPLLGLFDADVRPVGLNDDGSLAVPAVDEVGWYQYAGRPGAPGTTVLVSHVASGGRRGLFYRLQELRHGDRIRVDLLDGATTEWEVEIVATYSKAKLPVEQLFRADGDPMLVLITCGGVIDPVHGSYGDNIVVLAHPLG